MSGHHQLDPSALLHLIAGRTKDLDFPNLRRPAVPPNQPATEQLVNWGARLYCFAWIRHLSALMAGIIALRDSGNAPSAIIVARSAFELGAHAYYVKKHLKQHFDLGKWDAAWNFLAPMASGSWYINAQHPQVSQIFPASAHIRRAVNCFAEARHEAPEEYSFVSEFCHPNMLAFSQHYRWPNRFEVQFVDHEVQGWLGPTIAAALLGLMATEELLRLSKEKTVLPRLVKLLKDIVEYAGAREPGGA